MKEISIKKAAFITAVSKYSTIFLQLIISAFLARILTPKDYGIIAVTTVFTTFFSLFSDMGIGSGIVQNKNLSQDDINSIFTFSIRLALLLGVLFAVFSYPMSLFYKDTVYIPIGLLLSVSLFFSTLNMVPSALLMKQKRFVLLGCRTVILCVLSGTIGIIFALLGAKYYALILQTIFNSFFNFLWNYISTQPKLVKKINKESISKIRNYSSFLFAFSFINYFSRNSDNLLISKFMGTTSLGYYDKAYKLMCYPTQNLTHVITPVLHPFLSEHQNDKKYIYEKYLQIIKILSLCGIFIMPFCFFAGSEIIGIMFGERWSFAVPCFKFMSISIWAQMITSSSGSIFQALGNTKLMFISGTSNAILTVISILLGIMEGDINAVSRNIGIVYNIHFITTYIVLIHFAFDRSYRKFLKFLLPDFIIITLMFFSGYGISRLLEVSALQNIILKCAVRFISMLTIYVVCLAISGEFRHLMKLFKKK